MIIVNFSDGIGNQLFQLAIGLALAKERNEKVLFKNKDQYKLGEFDLDIEFFEDNFIWKAYSRLVQPTKIIDPVWKKIDIPRISVELKGYWAFPEYFREIEEHLLGLQLKNPSDQYLTLVQKINFSDSCAIHVRRGDYLLKEYKHLFALKDKNYFTNGMDHLKAKVPLQKVYIFSNDILWCKENLNFGVETIHCDMHLGLSDAEELFLMSNFDHIIISNSTFSWWSANFRENITKKKNIIMPELWYNLDIAQNAYRNNKLLYLKNSKKI